MKLLNTIPKILKNIKCFIDVHKTEPKTISERVKYFLIVFYDGFQYIIDVNIEKKTFRANKQEYKIPKYVLDSVKEEENEIFKIIEKDSSKILEDTS